MATARIPPTVNRLQVNGDGDDRMPGPRLISEEVADAAESSVMLVVSVVDIPDDDEVFTTRFGGGDDDDPPRPRGPDDIVVVDSRTDESAGGWRNLKKKRWQYCADQRPLRFLRGRSNKGINKSIKNRRGRCGSFFFLDVV